MVRGGFVPIDDILVERVFQPVADLISDRFGLDRRSAACFCADAACVAWIVSQAQTLSDAVVTWQSGMAFLRALLLLLGLAALSGLRTIFRRVSSGGKANPLRTLMRPYRALILLMLIARLLDLNDLALPAVADLAMLSFATIALYLGACATRPPAIRRGAPAPQAT